MQASRAKDGATRVKANLARPAGSPSPCRAYTAAAPLGGIALATRRDAKHTRSAAQRAAYTSSTACRGSPRGRRTALLYSFSRDFLTRRALAHQVPSLPAFLRRSAPDRMAAAPALAVRPVGGRPGLPFGRDTNTSSKGKTTDIPKLRTDIKA